MTDFKNTPELSESTEPAISYSTCYRLPFLSLFHADCMEIMKQYPDKYFDLAIVDPPYGIGAGCKSFVNGNRKVENNTHRENDWDNAIPTPEYFEQLFRVSKNQIIWGGNYFDLKPTRCFFIYDKTIHGNSYADCELAWTSFDKVARIFALNMVEVTKEGRIHATQKPIKLYDWILKHNATNGMKILDTHFGSGSIALAVDKANRLDKMNLHLTACEIDKEYIDKAIKRISESIKQGTLSF